LGTTENKLGISKWLADQGHELVTTSDKEGSGSEFRKHIVDADVLITTPFHPGYLTREVMNTAKQLKLAVTAGVGSDHIVSTTSILDGMSIAAQQLDPYHAPWS
jgi:formate dehydrogenase